ncbi:MAG: nucleoside triphosphate pyrophosphohydrolase [Gammaproteobacteria bacterium]|nr:nucleoside triphosphate pyrophosphohydrolase [Gammaproteobacteria bacterium]MAY03325.1 nucleoside triphosphate pyrophosphohydrolase [Gammaproteobacteria bacterium]|tara:strand:+ start:342 stop:1181 length:840 start_codon:yes stop_codon:yes gene_type:complete
MNKADTAMQELLKVMALLRDKDKGCPWDIKQDFQSIAPHTLEEVYEVIDCIEREDYQHLPEELGDLLFQVVFYTQMASEVGMFSFEDVCKAITRKLLTRHPHVFPDASIDSFGRQSDLSPEQVEARWEEIKQQERLQKGQKAESSLLEDVPQALPALLRARKLQGRAASGGFDWDQTDDVVAKLKEEVAELEAALQEDDRKHIEEEFGDMLFSMVNLARHLKLNPESSLRAANSKFSARFRCMEKLIEEDRQDLQSMNLQEMEKYWQKAKHKLSGSVSV